MAPRPAESARTTITITNPRRSAFIVTVPHGLTGGSAGDSNANLSKPPAKLQYNMRIANCRLTVVAALSMMHTGRKRTVSGHVEHSAYDCGLCGGFGHFWATKAAGIGAQF